MCGPRLEDTNFPTLLSSYCMDVASLFANPVAGLCRGCFSLSHAAAV